MALYFHPPSTVGDVALARIAWCSPINPAPHGDILDLINGSGGADLTLVMNSAVGSITGTVRDENGKPAGALQIRSLRK